MKRFCTSCGVKIEACFGHVRIGDLFPPEGVSIPIPRELCGKCGELLYWLKPCPFCGQTPLGLHVNTGHIHCEPCNLWFDLARWNIRA